MTSSTAFMTTSRPSLLILGASTRAAAASAVRAGFDPVCADRFGDEDLRRIASVIAVNNDLHRTLRAVKALPFTPWIYTGSLENDPKFIASVSERHLLLGNPAARARGFAMRTFLAKPTMNRRSPHAKPATSTLRLSI